MNLDLGDALQTFFAESRSLLQDMEAGLLRLESAPDDAEAINAIFRAAHTIKGSAGLFGLDDIVAFTHKARKRARPGARRRTGPERRPDRPAPGLPRPHRTAAGRSTAGGGGTWTPTPVSAGRGAGMAQLSALHGREAGRARCRPRRTIRCKAWAGGGRCTGDYLAHLAALRPGRAAQRHGPAVLHPLSRHAGRDRPPHHPGRRPAGRRRDGPGKLLPRLRDPAPRATPTRPRIEGVFEFVRDDCQLHILPPHSRVADYVASDRGAAGRQHAPGRDPGAHAAR